MLRLQKRLSERASNARTYEYNKTISILSISDSPLRFCSIPAIRMNMDDARNTSVDLVHRCGWQVNAIPIKRKIPRKKKARAKQRENWNAISRCKYVFFFSLSFGEWRKKQQPVAQVIWNEILCCNKWKILNAITINRSDRRMRWPTRK